MPPVQSRANGNKTKTNTRSQNDAAKRMMKKRKKRVVKNIHLEVYNIGYVVSNKYSGSVYYNTKYEARRDVKMQWFLCC